MLWQLILIANFALSAAQAGATSSGCVQAQRPVRSLGDAPACWHIGKEVVNRAKIVGATPLVNDRYDVRALKNTILWLKLCIDANGDVRKVFILRSTGNVELDADLCAQYRKWRFRPRASGQHAVPSVAYVTYEIYR